jgi:LysR family glycine cleavage system transcriptional activator
VDFHLTNDLAGPLLRDEVDLAVDCRAHVHPRIHRTALFREKYVVVAAPAWLERQPIRGTPDLSRATLLSLDAEGRWWARLLGALPAARRPRLGRVVAIDHVRGMIQATLSGWGVALLPKYAVLPELQRGALVVLFPRLRLHEDTFCVYQKLARLDRPGNRLVTAFLGSMDVREFGDAIGAGPLPPRPRPR